MFIVIKSIRINCNPHDFAKEKKNMDDGYHQWCYNLHLNVGQILNLSLMYLKCRRL
jgi:hypothetical protein